MRKLITILTILVLGFMASAEMVHYRVKYVTEYGNTQTVTIQVNLALTTEADALDLLRYIKDTCEDFQIEMIDEDSDAEDLAIVNKLERLGRSAGFCNGSCFLKPSCFWIRVFE